MKMLSGLLLSIGIITLTACATSGSGTASAGDLDVVESVSINAPASKVWAKVANFGDLGAFHPAVAKTEIKSGKNNMVGAIRLLTLQDGGTVNETLTAYSADKMSYAYIINESVLPVSHYSANIQVKPMGTAKSEVVWTAKFKRKDLSATPAKGQDDKAGTDTIHAVFKGGLDNLKKITE